MNDEHAEKRIVMNDETQFLHNQVELSHVNDEGCNVVVNAANKHLKKVIPWIFTESSYLSFLRELHMGDGCCKNAIEFKLIGLHELERVVIGRSCFCFSDPYNVKGHFYLKDCEKLKELKIGRRSFMDYSVCEIENVPSLEVIEIGTYGEWSCNFEYASLELKSDDDEMK